MVLRRSVEDRTLRGEVLRAGGRQHGAISNKHDGAVLPTFLEGHSVLDRGAVEIICS